MNATAAMIIVRLFIAWRPYSCSSVAQEFWPLHQEASLLSLFSYALAIELSLSSEGRLKATRCLPVARAHASPIGRLEWSPVVRATPLLPFDGDPFLR